MIDPRSVTTINYSKDARHKVKLIARFGGLVGESDWHDHRVDAHAEAAERLEALLAERDGGEAA